MLTTLPPPNPQSPIVNRKPRGAPLGNTNARKLGIYTNRQPHVLAAHLDRLKYLNELSRLPDSQPQRLLPLARQLNSDLAAIARPEAGGEYLPAVELALRTSALIGRLSVPIIAAISGLEHLHQLALDYAHYIRDAFTDRGIDRDADLFFVEPKKSTLNSPLLASLAFRPQPLALQAPALDVEPSIPDHLSFLTDEQWALLQPLLPPDSPHGDMDDDPPPLIAANRWAFTTEYPGEFATFIDLEENRRLNRIIRQLPSPVGEGLGVGSNRNRGRPRTSPRLLLDAIFWKLAKGIPWNYLPGSFPPWRSCQKYFRRLFRSGRLYTLLLALDHDLRYRGETDLTLLVENGLIGLDEGRKITISEGTSLTWQLRTALLLLQFAQYEARRQLRTSRDAI